MDPIENRKGERIRLESPVNEKVVLRNCEDCTIERETFTYNENGDQLELDNCVNCKIIVCTFKDKDTKGNFIHIRGEESKRNRIEGCTFKNQTYGNGEENGGEAIIVGLDKWSGCMYETKIRKCEFINCRGDDELVSIKSCDNIFENNRIDGTCKGNITVRQGGRNIIQNNLFEGNAGGIRVLGYGNEIKGNYHKNNDNGNDNRRPLIIENGKQKRDPNFNDNDEPIGRTGVDEGGDYYPQARRNTIEGNTYVNCKGTCVVWGRKEDRDEKPRGNTFRKNTLIADNNGDSEFLKFNDGATRDDNTFEGNKMYGEKAGRGDLREQEVEQLEDKPDITIPGAGPEARELAAAS
jgi:hypothetical protein